jgi:hypothetical protein
VVVGAVGPEDVQPLATVAHASIHGQRISNMLL